MDERIGAVLRHWDDLGPEGWYRGTAEIDAAIRARFEPLWQEARRTGLPGWDTTAEGALARLLVLDQFPRNMFRDRPESFATDAAALQAATHAIAQGQDLEIGPPLRQFFYLPLMHAEDLMAQTHCLVLFEERMPGENERHARAHRDVIARFGRFPWRNAALRRPSTAEEIAFLEAGGYAHALEAIAPLQR
ncbi:DUF924 family protein [Paenirhodobacter sp.]|uniref:DUF924 family protein n=1 Tax=Paenirhodobacter sp. TaxID=1965326 RepID=UPI003B3CCC77